MAVKFCAIASGSSGNSTFVGTEHTKILIDAGISGKCITQALSSLEIVGNNIDALFITHEHLQQNFLCKNEPLLLLYPFHKFFCG